MMDERAKTIPELRGFGYTPVPRVNREGRIDDTLYSPRSYAALYGITFEDAEEVCQMCNTHTQADRMITSTLAADPEKLREVIGAEQEEVQEQMDKYKNMKPAEILRLVNLEEREM